MCTSAIVGAQPSSPAPQRCAARGARCWPPGPMWCFGDLGPPKGLNPGMHTQSLCVCIYIYQYAYGYIYMFKCKCMRIRACIYIYVYMYVYMYIYLHMFLVYSACQPSYVHKNVLQPILLQRIFVCVCVCLCVCGAPCVTITTPLFNA